MATYTSQFPTQDADHVKANSYNATYLPHFATDPTKSVIGGGGNNAWVSASDTPTQRFHIDLGSGFAIARIYYENWHDNGGNTGNDAKAFTFWGSNSATAFAELTYGTDTNWTQLTTSQSTFDQHTAVNEADPKYITVTNTTAYQYYAVKMSTNYDNSTSYVAFRRIQLQTQDGVPPTTPTNSSPENAATSQSRNLTLTGNAFATTDPLEPTHASSTWEVATNSGMTTIVWSKTGDATNKTSIVVNSTNGTFAGVLSGLTKLANNITYYWHVKYKDSADVESNYSTATSFTTIPAASKNYLIRNRGRSRGNFTGISLG
jgi:hypothetical protein